LSQNGYGTHINLFEMNILLNIQFFLILCANI
jgi:hypothetical protein